MNTPDPAIDAIAHECVAQRLRILNRVVTNIYDDHLRPLRLKASQLNLLVATAKMGVASPLKVCALLHLDPSTLCRNVERMRARGWLETVPGPDARAQPFRLTSAGRKLLDKAAARWQVAQQQVAHLLGHDLVQRIDQVTRRLNATELKS